MYRMCFARFMIRGINRSPVGLDLRYRDANSLCKLSTVLLLFGNIRSWACWKTFHSLRQSGRYSSMTFNKLWTSAWPNVPPGVAVFARVQDGFAIDKFASRRFWALEVVTRVFSCPRNSIFGTSSAAEWCRCEKLARLQHEELGPLSSALLGSQH